MKSKHICQSYKILFFDHSNKMGGGERSLLDIINGLNDFDKVFVTPSKFLFDKFTSQNIRCIYFPMPQNVLKRRREKIISLSDIYNIPIVIKNFCRLLDKEKPSLIYTNTQKSHFIGVICSKIKKIPCICHFRDILYKGVSLKFWNLFISIFSTKIIAISKAVAKNLPIKKKIKVIYNGIKIEPNTINRTPQTDYTVGYVGQIARWKGIEYFIKAIPLIPDKNIKFIIVGGPIFGDYKYFDEIKFLAKNLGLNSRLQFLGEKEDGLSYIAKLNILVLSSIEPEPFGRVLIEAGVLGKPVIATRIGGIPEVVIDGETGILVPPKDEKAIADAILYLINNPQKRNLMGEKAKIRVAKYFNIEEKLKEIKELIYETCNSS